MDSSRLFLGVKAQALLGLSSVNGCPPPWLNIFLILGGN